MTNTAVRAFARLLPLQHPQRLPEHRQQLRLGVFVRGLEVEAHLQDGPLPLHLLLQLFY